MFKRNEEDAGRVGAAPTAFLNLSDEGTIELDERPAPARRAFALLLAGLVLLAAPLFWVNSAQGADQPLAVKSGNSGPNSGPDDGEDDDGDDIGDDQADDSVDTPTGTTQGTGPSNSATNTAQNQGQDDDDDQDDTTNGQQSNGTRENSATNTAQTGTGPNTNTKD